MYQSWTTLEKLRIGLFPVVSINKDATVTRIPALQGTQEGEEDLRDQQPLAAATPYGEH